MLVNIIGKFLTVLTRSEFRFVCSIQGAFVLARSYAEIARPHPTMITVLWLPASLNLLGTFQKMAEGSRAANGWRCRGGII